MTNTADFIESRLRLISSELLDVELNVEHIKKTHGLTVFRLRHSSIWKRPVNREKTCRH
jgi:hypothetical protein